MDILLEGTSILTSHTLKIESIHILRPKYKAKIIKLVEKKREKAL